MARYSKEEYWNMRYEATSTMEPAYEWYQSYQNLCHLLDPGNLAAAPDSVSPRFFPRKDCRILILGCGNSRLGEDMIRDGWTGRIVNVDFSPVVIEQLKSRYTDDFYKELEDTGATPCKMEFLCLDITKRLPFDDESFDLIVSKGSFDAILCSPGSMSNIRSLVEECVRLLKDGLGVFFLVTYGNPDSRVVYLEHDNELSYYWQGVSVHTVPGQKQPSKSDYIYICRKRSFKIKGEKESIETLPISRNENSFVKNKEKVAPLNDRAHEL